MTGPILAAGGGRPLRHRDVFAIALPITLSNATTPLIGFADTAVVGQLGEAHLIGAVAIAANIFSFLYWMFAFLRMGTTGFTAQALGAGDRPEIGANLARALLVAVAAGVLMILLQAPIATLALRLMGASPAVEAAARIYYEIRIWAAPAGLVNFALLGWFIGLGRAGTAFWLQLLLNLVNIVLAIALVMGLGMGVAGAGWAALLAEVSAAVVGLWVAWREVKARRAEAGWSAVLEPGRLRRMLAVNTDITIRTFSVLFAFSFFVAQGARAGDLTLAANAILHSLALITIFLLDGFAFAAETLVGQAIGAGERARYRRAVALSTAWAALFGLAIALSVLVAGPWLIDLATTNTEVRGTARAYLLWVALTPVIGVWCFQLDGIFVGATRTADMRNMMLASLAVYLAAWAVLQPAFANHGLWASLMVFYAARAGLLWTRLPALERAVFAGRA